MYVCAIVFMRNFYSNRECIRKFPRFVATLAKFLVLKREVCILLIVGLKNILTRLLAK